jgi:uncharacterized membrane protein YbhN (UPF0104 family)
VFLYGVATLARGGRWHLILRRSRIAHRRADAYALIPVGYMGNTVLPARGGELLRVLLLAKRAGVRRREVAGSIICERVCDVVALALLLALVTWVGVGGTPLGTAVPDLALAVVCVAGGAAWLCTRLRRDTPLSRLGTSLGPLVQPLRALPGRHGAALVGITVFAWVLEGAICWLIGRSLSLGIQPLEGLFLVVLGSFAALIPASPGYLGTYDGALVLGLKALGVMGGPAVAFVVLVRFVLFVPITVIGAGLLLLRYRRSAPLRDSIASDAFDSTLQPDLPMPESRGFA